MLMNNNRNGNNSAASVSMAALAAGSISHLRRTRAVVRFALRNGLVFVIGAGAVVGAELFLPDNAKFSVLTGAILGRSENAALREQIETLGKKAAAEEAGKVEAQMRLEKYKNEILVPTQNTINAVQAQLARVSQACTVLFQQYTVLNQAATQTQQEYIKQRAQLLTQTLAGQIGNATAGDSMANVPNLMPGLAPLFQGMTGDPQTLYRNAETIRQGVMQRFDAEMSKSMSVAMSNLKQWQPGIGMFARIEGLNIPQDCLQPAGALPQTTLAASSAMIQPPPLPIPSPVPPVMPASSEAFNAGVRDRRLWEAWITSQIGMAHAGAAWWAAVRNDNIAHTCAEGKGATSRAYWSACHESSQRLKLIDQRRDSDPDYRAGFSAYQP